MCYEQFYQMNQKFRRYVDRYCKSYRHNITKEVAFRHRIVQGVAEMDGYNHADKDYRERIMEIFLKVK